MPTVAGKHVDKNPAFEALHPRDRSGRDRGQFVDVPGSMAGLGGSWDAERGVWLIPSDRREDVDEWLKGIGFDAIPVPAGMRPINDEDRKKTWGPSTKIPPGWTDVMVTDDPNASVQVRGRDSQGRIQTIRSRAAIEESSYAKFVRVKALDEKMPAVDQRLSSDAMSSDTAAAMMLVRKMGLRPGSTKDTKALKQAYGASTLERRHVHVSGDRVRLQFVGKKGVNIDLEMEDADLARVLKRRMRGKAGNERLFSTNGDRMNRWVRETTGGDFTVKDFRTHVATSTAASMVSDFESPKTPAQRRAMELHVGGAVSKMLGNSRKQALESYIDPGVFDMQEGDELEVPGVEGRRLLEEAYGNGMVEGRELTGGNMNLSIKRVTLSDGTEAILKKPADGGEHRREIASSVAANALGFSTYTVDVGDGQFISTFIQGQPGSLALSSYGSVADEPVEAIARRPGGREMGVLDFLVRNRDRHDLNWMVTPEDEVVPIDHGLTFWGTEGADRDIPRGPFAQYWLGLSQKPTGRPARGRLEEDRSSVNGPRVKLDPKVSKEWLRELRERLLKAKSEYSSEEWDGMMKRLQMLEDAAPESIPGELPMRPIR